MSKVIPIFGKVARRIIIEIDEKGLQKVIAKDYMIASGETPETMVMLALPEARLTDTRMMIMSLMQTITIHLQAIFQSMQVGGTNASKTH